MTVLGTIGLFTFGAASMRGAGCTINDLYDRRLDRLVSRTQLRPLARGAVSVPAALTWAGAQCLLGAVVLLQFPVNAVFLAVPSMLLVCTYPLAKRVTQYPQFVLGMAFSWGAFLGFPALGVNMVDFGLKLPGIEMGTPQGLQTLGQLLSWDSLAALPTALSNLHLTVGDAHVLASAGLLYVSCIAWTLLYDTIYAFQDIRDDRRAGIKSTAQAFSSKRVHESASPATAGVEAPLATSYALNATTYPPAPIVDAKPKAVLATLLVVQTALLASSGYALGLSPIFYALSCGGCAATLAVMIRRVDLQDVGSCAWWFRMGCWITGGMIGMGLGGEYAARHSAENEVKGSDAVTTT